MKGKASLLLRGLIITIVTASCQKEIALAPEPQVKVGTKWEYYYKLYWPGNLIRDEYPITYTAVSEETIGNETWFKIVESRTGNTVWYLNKKTGGMYQYANNSSNLLFKYPAAVNTTYTTYNDGGTEEFRVSQTGDSTVVGNEKIPITKYEGTKNSLIVDKFWYNEKKWVVRREIWGNNILSPPLYYRKSTLILEKVTF